MTIVRVNVDYWFKSDDSANLFWAYCMFKEWFSFGNTWQGVHANINAGTHVSSYSNNHMLLEKKTPINLSHNHVTLLLEKFCKTLNSIVIINHVFAVFESKSLMRLVGLYNFLTHCLTFLLLNISKHMYSYSLYNYSNHSIKARCNSLFSLYVQLCACFPMLRTILYFHVYIILALPTTYRNRNVHVYIKQ